VKPIITDNPDYLWLYTAIYLTNKHNYDKIFTDNKGLAATTDGHRIHLIEHKGLLKPGSLYAPVPMGDHKMMLAYAGKDPKVPMWGIIRGMLNTRGRATMQVQSPDFPTGRFNSQYILESIPRGIAWVSPDLDKHVILKDEGRIALILPIVRIQH
jgi:hypothetical protein